MEDGRKPPRRLEKSKHGSFPHRDNPSEDGRSYALKTVRVHFRVEKRRSK